MNRRITLVASVTLAACFQGNALSRATTVIDTDQVQVAANDTPVSGSQSPDFAAMIQGGQYAAAASGLSRALQSSPNDGKLWLLLGQANLGQNDAIGAQQAFDRAMAIDGQAHLSVGAIYLWAGEARLQQSDIGKAEQFFRLAQQYDTSLGSKVASLYFDRGKAALQLRNSQTAVPLFNDAVQFDSSRKAVVAVEFGHAAMAEYEFKNFEGAERYLRLALGYDRDVAQDQARQMFDQFTVGLCNLGAVGKQKFLAEMKLFNATLGDQVKTSLPYRFAYAVNLLEDGHRIQAIDILHDIALSPKGCQQAAAEQILAPPEPGRRLVTAPEYTAIWGPQTVEILYADVSTQGIKVTISVRNIGSAPITLEFQRLDVPRLNSAWGQITWDLPAIEDDNGNVLKTSTAYVGNSIGRIYLPDGRTATYGVRMLPGQQVVISASFPMVTTGAQQFKFIQATWSSPYIRLKPDPLGD